MQGPKHYVSKLVSITAVQWTGENIRAIQEFVAPSSPYYQPARPAKEGSASDIMNEHRKALLSVMVPDPAANQQWPAIAPHFKMQPVEMNGWLLRRDDDPNHDVIVLSEKEFRSTYDADDRPPVGLSMPDGIVRVPASQVSAFPSGVPIQASHPRAMTTSDARVAPPPARVPASREPATDAAGDVVDIDPHEAPDAGDGK